MGLPTTYPFPTHQVKFYGPFELHELVQGVKKFLDDRNYNFTETFKMKKGGSGWAFDTEWTCDIKATTFVKKHITIKWLIQEIRDVEIVVDGKKRKIQHGRGLVEIKGAVEFGYTKDWTDDLKRWFIDFAFKQEYLGKWVDGHWYELQDLASLVRRLLNFEVK